MDDITSTEATPTAATEISTAPLLTQPTAATEISTAPLLTRQATHDSLFGEGARALTTISMFLGLFAGYRGASMIVRESAAEQLKNWRDICRYSLPVVVTDTMWNLAFVFVSIAMLIWTAREQPNVPVRVWIGVYALQCAVHVVLVWWEYWRRRNRRASTAGSSSTSSDGDRSSNGDSRAPDATSWPKRFETANTIVQYIWWLGGFCWFTPNFEPNTAPRLFWLTLTFMGIEVLCAAINGLKGLITSIAVCFCHSFIMVFLYFMDDQVGASEAEIKALPKYRFVAVNEPNHVGGNLVPFETNTQEFSQHQDVPFEEVDCCMCLFPYELGTELVMFPCKHPFHVTCIMKWLKISRICPLCKKNAITHGEEV